MGEEPQEARINTPQTLLCDEFDDIDSEYEVVNPRTATTSQLSILNILNSLEDDSENDDVTSYGEEEWFSTDHDDIRRINNCMASSLEAMVGMM